MISSEASFSEFRIEQVLGTRQLLEHGMGIAFEEHPPRRMGRSIAALVERKAEIEKIDS